MKMLGAPMLEGGNNKISKDKDYFNEKYPSTDDKYKQLEDKFKVMEIQVMLGLDFGD